MAVICHQNERFQSEIQLLKMFQYSAIKKWTENLIHRKVLQKCELLHPQRKLQISFPDDRCNIILEDVIFLNEEDKKIVEIRKYCEN